MIDFKQLLEQAEPIEAGFIASLLQHPGDYALVSHIKVTDFLHDEYRAVYNVIQRLDTERRPIEFVNIATELAHEKHASEQTLHNILEVPIGQSRPDDYVGGIEKYSMIKQVSQGAKAMLNAAGDPDTTADALAERWHSIGYNLRYGHRDTATMQDAVSEHMDRIDLIMQGVIEPGVMTGLNSIDAMLGGLKAGKFYVVGGQPGMGKTYLMLTWMLNQLKDGKRVGFFSLEMTKRELVSRLISMQSAINVKHVGDGDLSLQDEYPRYVKTAGEIYNLVDRLHVDDRSGLTPAQMRSKFAQWQAEHGDIDVLYVDYLTLANVDGRHSATETEKAVAISRALTEMAKDANTPLVAVSQLSRGYSNRQDKRPLMSDLKNTSQIEQDAYAVAFIYRPYVFDKAEDRNLAEFIVRKHRDGPSGICQLYYDYTIPAYQNGVSREINLK